MTMGIPYDSDAGRGICGALTALLNGQGYLTSSEMAGNVGPFAGYRENEAADAQRHADAPRRRRAHRPGVPGLSARRRPRSLGRRAWLRGGSTAIAMPRRRYWPRPGRSPS